MVAEILKLFILENTADGSGSFLIEISLQQRYASNRYSMFERCTPSVAEGCKFVLMDLVAYRQIIDALASY